MAEAQSAGEKIMREPKLEPFLGMIDAETVKMEHCAIRSRTG